MTAYAISLLERDERSELLRWGTAALIVVAIHLVLMLAHRLLWSETSQGVPEVPAIIIDLAPLPAAPASLMDITPGPEFDQVTAPAGADTGRGATGDDRTAARRAAGGHVAVSPAAAREHT